MGYFSTIETVSRYPRARLVSLLFVTKLQNNLVLSTSGTLEFQARPAPMTNPGQEKMEWVKAGWLDQLAVTEPRPLTLFKLLMAAQPLEMAASGQPAWNRPKPRLRFGNLNFS